MIEMQADFNLALGNTLKKLRRSAGLSQDELADRAEVSQQTISKLENHSVEPRRKTIVSIANVLLELGISDNEVFKLFEQAGMSSGLITGIKEAPEDSEANKDEVVETSSYSAGRGGFLSVFDDFHKTDFARENYTSDSKALKMKSYFVTEKASICMKLMLEIANEDPELLEYLRTNLEMLQARTE